MAFKLEFRQIFKCLSIAAALSVVGVFLCVRLKAFLIQAWAYELPMWSLMLLIALMLVIGALFCEPILKWLKRWAVFPSISSGIVAAVSILLAWLWSDRIYDEALLGSGVTVSGAMMLLYILGGGLLLSLFILCLFVSIRDRFREIIASSLKFSRFDAIFLLAISVVLNLVVLIYAKNSSTIYFWDNAGYWTTSHQLCKLWQSEGFAALIDAVLDSVTTLDYNYIIILPAIVAVRLFGTSRYVFLAAIANVWLYPTYVLIWGFARSRCKHAYLTAAAVILSLPMLVYNVLIGFIDVGGVVLIAAALILLFTDKAAKADFGRYFLIGAFLAAALLLRRWYAFYALAFIVALAVIGTIAKRTLIPVIGALSSFAFILLFFFQTLVSGKLLADYGAMYVAYSIGLDKDFLLFFRYYGVLLTVIWLAASVWNIIKDKHRAANLLVLIQSVLCFAMFSRVQTHGQQHLLLYAANFIFPLILALGSLEALSPRRIASLAALGCSLVMALSPFLPRVQPASREALTTPTVLPSFSWSPPRRDDSRTIVDLMRRLDEYGESGDRVGILASSFILNEDILLNAEASLSLPRVSDVDRGYLVVLPAVDQRDGWSDTLLTCDVLVVADPIQLHLGEENQAVVWLPAEEILSGEGIGGAFRLTEDCYVLNDGVTAYIYEKTREITAEEWAELTAKFRAIHP